MLTYPNEIWPADAVIEALDGTTDPATGLPYIAKGTGPTSVPTYEVQYNRREHRLAAILASWRQGMVVNEGNLKIGAYPVDFTLGGYRRSFLGATGVNIPDQASKVVYLDSSAELVVADNWPDDPTVYLPLAELTTSNGQVSITDTRPLAAFHVPSLEASRVRDRRIVTAHRTTIGSGESASQIFAFAPGQSMTLEEVQVYCSAVAATASVDVREAGSSVLSAPATPVAGTIVKPTISDGSISAANSLTIHVTTGASGGVSDLTVTLLLKAPLAM